MLMILAHHFVVHNAFDVQSLPLGLNRFVLEVFFEGSGKVGVVVFFTISAWYLMDKSQSLRSSFLRIWEMEGTLLFYGLTLLLLFVIFDRGSLTAAVAVNSVFPLMRRCWWYTSAYAAFLLLLPFLRIGLLRIGRSVHLALALLLLAVWGGSTLLPGVSILKDDVFGFIYLAVVISAYKWYLMPAKRQGGGPLALVVGGYAIIAACWGVTAVCQLILGKSVGVWVAGPMSLPVTVVGFGLFLLFERMEFKSRIVNEVSACALAVYLITDYVPMRGLLWDGLLNLGTVAVDSFALVRYFAALLGIFVCCILVELFRVHIFKFLSRHEVGYWFNRAWASMMTLLPSPIVSVLEWNGEDEHL